VDLERKKSVFHSFALRNVVACIIFRTTTAARAPLRTASKTVAPVFEIAAAWPSSWQRLRIIRHIGRRA
jgi:hypothetical protein